MRPFILIFLLLLSHTQATPQTKVYIERTTRSCPDYIVLKRSGDSISGTYYGHDLHRTADMKEGCYDTAYFTSDLRVRISFRNNIEIEKVGKRKNYFHRITPYTQKESSLDHEGSNFGYPRSWGKLKRNGLSLFVIPGIASYGERVEFELVKQ